MRRLIAATLAVLALGALPGAALAQSGGAGDNQYVDPFGSSNSQQQQQSSGSKGGSGTSTGPALSSTPTLSGSSSAPSTTAAAPAQTLPRTGLDVGLVAALGLVALVMGAALRLRLRDDRL